MTKTELFLDLAKPNNKGESRWVLATEFIDKYKDLQLGNGGSWCRGSSSLAKKFLIEFDKSQSSGNSIDAIRLIGLNVNPHFSHNIRKDIKEFYKNKNCVIMGINGNSENTKVEIDHKAGRKDDPRISNSKTQLIEDFQPLCKAANDAKRQICKKCKETNKRWNAKNLKGNPYSFYEGDEDFKIDLGCKGCYQYDPVQYRITSISKVSKEAAEYVANKLMLGE